MKEFEVSDVQLGVPVFKMSEKPNVYVIHNECFVVMLSSCWNNTP
jgi:hypothetical protein